MTCGAEIVSLDLKKTQCDFNDFDVVFCYTLELLIHQYLVNETVYFIFITANFVL